MSSRVGEVRVRARVPAALAEADANLRQRLERDLVVGFLEELERRVHATLGADAIVHVRHLALRWQLEADEVGDPAVLTRLADELVRDLLTTLDAQAPAERLRPRDGTIVGFVDAHHATAAWLADAGEQAPPRWFQAARTEPAATWDEVVAAGPATVTTVLAWLERMGRVEEALALASDAVLATVAACAPARAAAVALVRARRQLAGLGRAPAPAVAPAPALGSSGPSPRGRLDDGMAPGSGVEACVDLAPLPPGAPAPVTDLDAIVDRVEEPTSRTRPDVTADVARVDAAVIGGDPRSAAVASGAELATRHAGLFYLIGRALELELGEHLWRVGLDDRAVLAAIARTIIGADDDGACAWFGGNFDRVPATPTIPAWAAAEVAEALQHSLGLRLVRFGVATTPAALARQLDQLAALRAVDAGLDLVTGGALRRCAAALTILTAARLEAPPTWSVLDRVVRRDGRLIHDDTAVHVVLPSAAFDLDLRRAGLDHNPAYVPWLARTLSIEFVGLPSI